MAARYRSPRTVRPSHIEPVGPGEESVWAFPRPPRVERVAHRVRVDFNGRDVANSTNALRVVETAGAPCYYIPPADCDLAALVRTERWTLCEWKGVAYAYDLRVDGTTSPEAAWSYPDPFDDLGEEYARIAGWFAFYANRVDACYLDDERIRAQPGGFYGGWVTSRLRGPIKGEPGSESW